MGATVNMSSILRGRPVHIVVAEADDRTRALIAATFATDGQPVVHARTGLQVVDAVRGAQGRDGASHAVELLVIDDELPQMSGLVALDILSDWGIRIPTILVTANSDLWLEARAGRLGARVLKKPIEPDVLRAAVCEVLASASQALELADVDGPHDAA